MLEEVDRLTMQLSALLHEAATVSSSSDVCSSLSMSPFSIDSSLLMSASDISCSTLHALCFASGYSQQYHDPNVWLSQSLHETQIDTSFDAEPGCHSSSGSNSLTRSIASSGNWPTSHGACCSSPLVSVEGSLSTPLLLPHEPVPGAAGGMAEPASKQIRRNEIQCSPASNQIRFSVQKRRNGDRSAVR